MENQTDHLEVENPGEELDSTPEQGGESADESADTSAKLSKAEEIAKNQRIRAEKAEKELKALKGEKGEPAKGPSADMSLKDIRALQDVPDEDIDEVLDFAKYKGISVSEAKSNPVMQTLLRTKAEERATANAANTGNIKRNANTNTDEQLLKDFESGVVPQTEEDIDRLVAAQMAQKKAAVQGN